MRGFVEQGLKPKLIEMGKRPRGLLTSNQLHGLGAFPIWEPLSNQVISLPDTSDTYVLRFSPLVSCHWLVTHIITASYRRQNNMGGYLWFGPWAGATASGMEAQTGRKNAVHWSKRSQLGDRTNQVASGKCLCTKLGGTSAELFLEPRKLRIKSYQQA
jgi:hypothetical protein